MSYAKTVEENDLFDEIIDKYIKHNQEVIVQLEELKKSKDKFSSVIWNELSYKDGKLLRTKIK